MMVQQNRNTVPMPFSLFICPPISLRSTDLPVTDLDSVTNHVTPGALLNFFILSFLKAKWGNPSTYRMGFVVWVKLDNEL